MMPSPARKGDWRSLTRVGAPNPGYDMGAATEESLALTGRVRQFAGKVLPRDAEESDCSEGSVKEDRVKGWNVKRPSLPLTGRRPPGLSGRWRCVRLERSAGDVRVRSQPGQWLVAKGRAIGERQMCPRGGVRGRRWPCRVLKEAGVKAQEGVRAH